MIIYDLLWGNSFARSFIGSFMVLLRILGMAGNAGDTWGQNFVAWPLAGYNAYFA